MSGPILDSLTHVTPDGRWFDTSHDASVDRLLREMDASGTEGAVVTALAGHIANDFVADTCAKHASRLIPGASIDPSACPEAGQVAATARAEVKDGPFRVLKLHPRLHRYDPLEPRCLALLEEVASWRKPLPIWLCSLMRYPGCDNRKSPVDSMHFLAGRFPGLTFVFLHGGGAEILQLAEAIRDVPNAFLDVSFTAKRYQGGTVASDISWLLETFDRRLLFGSDFPEVSLGDAVETVAALGRNVASSKMDRVMGGNLSGILARHSGLPEPEDRVEA